MAGSWCPTCAGFVPAGATCGDCRRRRAWGVVNRTIHSLVGGTTLLTVLEAIAILMQERQALIHQHRREMNAEIQAGQRAARESWDDGHTAGRIEGASER